MNSRILFWPVIAFAPLLVSAGPAVGDTRAAVEAELGKPTIQRKPGDGSVIARYPRGTVTYRDDRVTAATVLDDAEWQARLASEKLTEGYRALDTLRLSPAYVNASMQGKFEMLGDFSKKYPQIDVAALRSGLAIGVDNEKLVREWNLKREQEASVAREAEVAALRKDLETARRERAEALAARDQAEARTPVIYNPAGYYPYSGFGYGSGLSIRANYGPVSISGQTGQPGRPGQPGQPGKPGQPGGATVVPGKLVQPAPYVSGYTIVTPQPVFVPDKKTGDKPKP